MLLGLVGGFNSFSVLIKSRGYIHIYTYTYTYITYKYVYTTIIMVIISVNITRTIYIYIYIYSTYRLPDGVGTSMFVCIEGPPFPYILPFVVLSAHTLPLLFAHFAMCCHMLSYLPHFATLS